MRHVPIPTGLGYNTTQHYKPCTKKVPQCLLACNGSEVLTTVPSLPPDDTQAALKIKEIKQRNSLKQEAEEKLTKPTTNNQQPN